MKNKLSFTACLLLLAYTLPAQSNTKGPLAIGFGGSVTYYYGPGSRNFDQYETDRVNGQLDGMLGLRLGGKNGGNGTLLAAFGSYGLANRTTVRQLLADQRYTSTAVQQSSQNNYYRLEGGVLLGEVFRISTGMGQQFFNKQTLLSAGGQQRVNVSSLEFYSTTLGFYLNVSTVAIMLNVNVAHGKDFDETVFTPSAGLTFLF